MPIAVTVTAAAGFAYTDIRIGDCVVHQTKLDVSAFTSLDDANGTLPPGLPIITGGLPCTGTTDVVLGIIGPEPAHLNQAADHFVNVIVSGVLNYQAIEDNLGRVWDANELASVKLDKAIKVLPAVSATS